VFGGAKVEKIIDIMQIWMKSGKRGECGKECGMRNDECRMMNAE
jgi:hypothetical protein